MNAESPTFTEPSINDSMLVAAQYICETRKNESKLGEENRWFKWQANPADFSPLIGVEACFNKQIINNDFTVVSADLCLPEDDMEAGAKLDSNETFNDDEFAIYIWEKFRQALSRGSFEDKFGGLLQRIREQREVLRQENLMSKPSHTDNSHSKPEIKITDKRKVTGTPSYFATINR